MLHLLKKKNILDLFLLLFKTDWVLLRKDWYKLDHYELKSKYRSSTSHNMKKYIFSYNNISSTIRALVIAARFKKGFHEIICHSDVL